MLVLFLSLEVTQYRPEPGLKSKSDPKGNPSCAAWCGRGWCILSLCAEDTPPGYYLKMRKETFSRRKDVRMVGSMNSLLGRPYSENKGFPSRWNKSQETKEFNRVGA